MVETIAILLACIAPFVMTLAFLGAHALYNYVKLSQLNLCRQLAYDAVAWAEEKHAQQKAARAHRSKEERGNYPLQDKEELAVEYERRYKMFKDWSDEDLIVLNESMIGKMPAIGASRESLKT